MNKPDMYTKIISVSSFRKGLNHSFNSAGSYFKSIIA